MTKLTEQRKRAIEILFDTADVTTPMLIDYELDTYCRDKLNLPNLPEGQLPYEGWMVGKKQSTDDKYRISPVGISLIKRWEGCRLKAYKCSGNVWTIGYGHTRTVKSGQKITQTQAEMLLATDLTVYEKAVNEYIKVKLTQNQFDALVSFCYNVGCNAFRHSTLVRLLNQEKYTQASEQFNRWTIAGGRRVQGLVNRRKQERELFGS